MAEWVPNSKQPDIDFPHEVRVTGFHTARQAVDMAKWVLEESGTEGRFWFANDKWKKDSCVFRFDDERAAIVFKLKFG